MKVNIKCPSCSKSISIEDETLETVFCIQCGTRISLASYFAPKCPRCGKKGVGKEQAFCLFCGSSMTSESIVGKPTSTPGICCPNCDYYMRFKNDKSYVYCNNCGIKIEKPR